MTAATSLESRIRQVLDERAMLGHPFFQRWSEGRLEREALRELARQYYHFEASFPRFLSTIHARTASPRIRQTLLENLYDEEHGTRNHPALWLEFALALDLTVEAVTGAGLRAETRALIEHYETAAREAPLAEALATLFAFEGQVPGIAWQMIKGLTDQYGFRPEQFEFFSVHLVSDISHAGAEMDAIRETCEREEAVVAATARACDRLLAFLDGCSRTEAG
jgi:pyrroloquinoline-quinone synthase